jgi:Protein of unknown function (DUF3592)
MADVRARAQAEWCVSMGAWFTLLGLPLLLIVLVEYRWERRELTGSQTWSSSEGTLFELRWACERVARREACHPRVAYDYHVPEQRLTPGGIRDVGRTYTGTQITFGDEDLSAGEDWDEIVRRYRRGAGVVVFYDPHEPGNAVLERRIPRQPTAPLWIASANLGVGILLLLYGRTMLRRREAAKPEP